MVKNIVITLLILIISNSYSQNLDKEFINPLMFQKETAVNYTLKNADTVSITIYNRWGQLVIALLNKSFKTAGTYTEKLNMDGIPDEFYAVALRIGDKTYANTIVKNEHNLVKSRVADFGVYYEVDSTFKVYPRSSAPVLDLATSSVKMENPANMKSSLGCSDVRVASPINQIMNAERGNLSIEASINAPNAISNIGGVHDFVKGKENKLYGRFRNNCLFTEYRDQIIMIVYYDKNGTKIESRDVRVYGVVNPGTSKSFELKISPPENASKFSVVVNRYYTDIGRMKTVSREQIQKAQSISDIISGYPVNEYANILNYVSITILAVNMGELKSAENTNVTFTDEQKQILNAVDSGTTIGVEIKFKYKDPHFDDLGSNRKIKEMSFMVKVGE